MSRLSRIENLLLSLWIGSMVGIGYIAAPVLFRLLDDRKLAGTLAGEMFSIVGLAGMIIGLLLVGSYVLNHKLAATREWRFWVLCAMLIIVILSHFVVQPYMAELKLQGLVEGSKAAKHFGMMHGVSSIMYLITNLLGALLIIMGLQPRARRVRASDLNQL
jgi:hypothetical protein